MAKKENKYFVLKISDVEASLTDTEQVILEALLDKLANENEYVICNQDEPYIDEIWNVILSGEDVKNDL